MQSTSKKKYCVGVYIDEETYNKLLYLKYIKRYSTMSKLLRDLINRALEEMK
ncbi:MAG: hypothetical protein QW607_10800 [Desulfurococcaceae archaeon]